MEVFRNTANDPQAIPMDLPVGPDYVIGPGDGLEIDLWGGVSQRLFRVVDREGRVSLPETGPLLVGGRNLGDAQQAVQQVLRTQYRDISADVSLSRLRTVRVYVVGDVAEPGAYDISSLSTPLNALFAAGGVTPRGSLRALKHYRGKQLVEEVDAYDLLLHGVRSDMRRLENGDTLLVPSLGPQVTVDGMVRRPAIYELHGESSLADVLELAGGILPTATLRHIEVQRVEAHEKRTMLTLDLSAGREADSANKQLDAFKVNDGDEIHIFPIAPYNEDAIYIQGHVLRPGRYSYKQGMSLSDLIGSYKDLLPEPAPHYAEIVRLNPPDFHPSVESFDLTAALANPASAPKLQPLDTVRVFSRYDFEPAPEVWIGGEVRELLHLAHLDHLVLRGRAAGRPLHRLLLRLHLNHPVAAEHLLRLGEGAVGHLGPPSRERDARAHRGRVEAIEREQDAGLLQRFVVLHHCRHGPGVRHGARRGLLVSRGKHQHHESHVLSPCERAPRRCGACVTTSFAVPSARAGALPAL